MACLIYTFHRHKLRLYTPIRQNQDTKKIRTLFFIVHTRYYHSAGQLDQSVASIGICQPQSAVTVVFRHNERYVSRK
jgi:hypothetical protein